MSEWGWVGLAYTVAYGSLAVFIGSISLRIRSSRRRLEALTGDHPR